MTNKNDVRKLADKAIRECQGDTLVAYAAACNRTLGPSADETLLAVKRELARRVADEALEDNGWVRSETGQWRK